MVLEEIKSRHSVRNFSDKDVPDEILEKILEAARLAPSWVNVQPWQFIVIRNGEQKQLLSKLAHGQPDVAKSSVIIACCGDLSSWDKENYKKILQSRPGITEEKVNALLNNPGFNPELKGKNAVLTRTVEELTYSIAYMTLDPVKIHLA